MIPYPEHEQYPQHRDDHNSQPYRVQQQQSPQDEITSYGQYEVP